jgi:chemotaxis protein MotA
VNLSSILSFLIAGTVFGLAVFASATDPRAFLNLDAALVVFGGTIAAAAISFQIDRLFVMFKVFFVRIFRGHTFDCIPLIEELMGLAELYRTEPEKLPERIKTIKDPFLKEGMEGLVEKIMPEADLFRMLTTRSKTIFQRYHNEALRMKSIAKFPPAFGLMGATLGMISLLRTVATVEGQKNVGPAMAVALVGTLYGIAFANLVLLPVGEQLIDSARELQIKNRIIVEGLKLIASRQNPVILAEELNSFLLAGERINWRKIKKTKTDQNSKAA